MRWLKPGVDFGKYNKVMLDSVIFFFADDSEYKGMDPQELKEIADAGNRQMVDILKGSYPTLPILVRTWCESEPPLPI